MTKRINIAIDVTYPDNQSDLVGEKLGFTTKDAQQLAEFVCQGKPFNFIGIVENGGENNTAKMIIEVELL